MSPREPMGSGDPVTQRDLQRFIDVFKDRDAAHVERLKELTTEVSEVKDKVTNHLPTQINAIEVKMTAVETTQKLTLNTFIPIAVALGSALAAVVVTILALKG